MRGGVRTTLGVCMLVSAPAYLRAGDEPRIEISITPDRILLGAAQTAEIRIRLTGTGRRPELSTNVGSIQEAREVEPQLFVATYEPPAVPIPQVAIIVALVSGPGGGVQTWTTLPLLGKGTAIARTSPGGRITVRIRDEIFGPVIADQDGIARVPVVVPPGVDNAYGGDQAIALGVPRTNHLHAVLDVREISAARQLELPVRIYVVEPDGSPREQAALSLTASRGEITDPVPVNPGYYEARWRLPPRLVGRDRLEVQLTDEPESLAVVDLDSKAGLPARLELEVEPAVVIAGANPRLTATARVFDGGDNPVPAELAFSTSFGELAEAVAVEPGIYAVEVRLPAGFDDRERLVVTAETNDGLSGETSVVLKSAPPAVLELAAGPTSIVADGEQALRLQVSARDAFGNRVADVALTTAADPGTVTQTVADTHGATTLTYVPPRSLVPGTATVTAEVGPGVRLDLAVELLPAPARLVVAPRVGLLTNFSRVTSPDLGAEIFYWLELWSQQVGFGLDVSYALVVRNLSSSPDNVSVEANSHFFCLTGQVAWRHELPSDWALWLEAGGGLSVIASTTTVAGQPSVVAATASPVVVGSGAVGIRLWRGFLFGEIGFRYQGDPGLTNLRGDIPSLTAVVGYRFHLL